MKTCTRCKITQEKSEFHKSSRYSDGLYVYCRECCRKEHIASCLRNPLCCRCKKVPHLPNQKWCYNCHRIVREGGRPAKFRRDVTNKLYCSKCRVVPHTEYGRYCLACALKANEAWRKRRGDYRTRPEHKRKATARHYVNTLFKRGKIKRQPCEVCGAPSQHFHHLDYKDRTTNVQHLCFPCHVNAEREKRNLKK